MNTRLTDYARRYGAVYCVLHGMQHSPICPICAADRYPPNVAALESTAAADAANRRKAQRDVLLALESWIADLSAENVDLRRRVSELESRANHQQEAHNTTVAYAESIDARLNEAEILILQLLDHAAPRADLLP